MVLDSPNGQNLGRYLALGSVGLEMVAPIGLGLIVDYYLNWGQWGVSIGAVLGLAGGVTHLVLLANRLGKEDSDKKSSGPKSEAK
jgi:F0F1-type ATP synthase assembly protein I